MNNPFRKQATGPYVAGASPEAVDLNNSLKAEALRRALKAGLLGLGAGAGMAGTLGLPQLLRGSQAPSFPLQTEVDLPYPQVAPGHAKKKKGHKEAADVAGGPLFFGGLDAAATAASSADPVEGALYGAGRGALRGAAYAPGAVTGSALASRLLDLPAAKARLNSLGDAAGRAVKGRPDLKALPRTLKDGTKNMAKGIAGAAGGFASRAALRPLTDAAAKASLGKPPEHKGGNETSRKLLQLAGAESGATKKADFADAAVKGLGMASKPGDPSPTVGSPTWLRGDGMNSVGSIPWAVPTIAGAAGAGLFGGHALVRHLLARRRKAGVQKELAAARKEYEEAMLSQYDPSKLRDLGPKEASAVAVCVLDVCYDALKKDASLFNEVAGTGAGLYGTGAGLLALGSGIGTYKWLQGRSQQKVLKDALKRRALLRSLANPPEMTVRPVPVEYVEDEKERGR